MWAFLTEGTTFWATKLILKRLISLPPTGVVWSKQYVLCFQQAFRNRHHQLEGQRSHQREWPSSSSVLSWLLPLLPWFMSVSLEWRIKITKMNLRWKSSCNARIVNDKENPQRTWEFKKANSLFLILVTLSYTLGASPTLILFIFIDDLNEKSGIPSKPRKVSIAWRMSIEILQVSGSVLMFIAIGDFFNPQLVQGFLILIWALWIEKLQV